MNTTYTLKIGAITRTLPLVAISKTTAIASFVMLGDTELNEECGRLLAEKIPAAFPQTEILVCPEAKAIALTQVIARHLKCSYVVVRKTAKSYMQNPLIETVQSITTAEKQTLVLDGCEANRLKGKHVLIVDDVVSTGGSLKSLTTLLTKAGCIIEGSASVLLEETGFIPENFICLEKLPVFLAAAGIDG